MVGFIRLHTLELPRDYQLKTWVDIHRRKMWYSRRLRRSFPAWKDGPKGKRVPWVVKERVLVSKRVLSCNRRFEVHVWGLVLSFARAFGKTKKRFVNHIISRAVALRLARSRGQGLWSVYGAVSSVGGGVRRVVNRNVRRSKLGWRAGCNSRGPMRVVNRILGWVMPSGLTPNFSTTRRGTDHPSRWEVAPLLESGTAGLAGAANRLPHMFLLEEFTGLLLYLLERLGVGILVLTVIVGVPALGLFIALRFV